MARALLLLLSCAAFGQVRRFELAPAAPTARIGDPIELSGTASFPSRFRLEAPIPGLDTGHFEIISAEAAAPRVEGEAASATVRLKVAAFALGEQTLPSLRWSLRSSDGAQETLDSPPVKLSITGPKIEEDADIRDIAGPLSPKLWPWALLAALAAAGAAALAWRAWARRRAEGAPEAAAAPDERTPDEVALDELRKLAAGEMPIKEYYDRLSDILRLYLERRFEVPALRLTTGDLHRRLLRTPATPEARALAKSLLERCDLVKFARHIPSAEDQRKDLNAAGQAVVMTRPPKPEPAPAPGVQP